MPSLKEIRNRIQSVGSTMQITSAMKMVSAAKLKRAQDAITQMRPYSHKLQEILSNLSATLDLSENAYSEAREVKDTRCRDYVKSWFVWWIQQQHHQTSKRFGE